VRFAMGRTIVTKMLQAFLLVLSVTLLMACSESPAPSATEQSELQATAETHGNDAPVATPVASIKPAQTVITSRIAYGEINNKNIHGYLSVPANATGSLPALIVIHDWWGLNDNIKATSERLAGEGYVTLAVDLYGEQVAETPKEAMVLMQNLTENSDLAIENLVQAYTYLSAAAGAPKVGVVGWCLGGRWSLQTALALPEDIDAMVMYYGAVETDKQRLATLNMPILGLFAGDDPIVPRNTIDLFRTNLRGLGKNASVFVYEDSKHAFANPSGLAYDWEAAEDAWNKMLEFFYEHLVSIKE
jgi:carboxymethylenebutenolidase